jgi:hypothetical protein
MTNQIACLVCGNPRCGTEAGPVTPGTPIFGCPRCGRYLLEGRAQDSLKRQLESGAIDRSMLSHIIRKSQRDQPFEILFQHLSTYLNIGPPPTPREQAENLILWIGDKQQSPDKWESSASNEALAAIVGARISINESAFHWLLTEIAPEQWFEVITAQYQIKLRLSIKGWDFYQQLCHKHVVSRTAFMAMQFGDGMLNKMFENCFKPAVALAGFELRSVNEGQGAGLIDNQIRAAIRSARFVLADLTHDNNGAYFEAGFGEGLGLPVIYTCEVEKFNAKKTHFDTNHMVTIPWDEADPDSAASSLTATIRNTLPGEAS